MPLANAGNKHCHATCLPLPRCRRLASKINNSKILSTPSRICSLSDSPMEAQPSPPRCKRPISPFPAFIIATTVSPRNHLESIATFFCDKGRKNAPFSNPCARLSSRSYLVGQTTCNYNRGCERPCYSFGTFSQFLIMGSPLQLPIASR